MVTRCTNQKCHAFKNYGGRGIKVCERWMKFANFYADMGQRPSLKHSLDRIDTNGDYCPTNCRWATDFEQRRNRRDITTVCFRGETLCLTEWASRTGINRTTIEARLAKGWPIEKALTDKPMSLSEAGRIGGIARHA